MWRPSLCFDVSHVARAELGQRNRWKYLGHAYFKTSGALFEIKSRSIAYIVIRRRRHHQNVAEKQAHRWSERALLFCTHVNKMLLCSGASLISADIERALQLAGGFLIQVPRAACVCRRRTLIWAAANWIIVHVAAGTHHPEIAGPVCGRVSASSDVFWPCFW